MSIDQYPLPEDLISAQDSRGAIRRRQRELEGNVLQGFGSAARGVFIAFYVTASTISQLACGGLIIYLTSNS